MARSTVAAAVARTAARCSQTRAISPDEALAEIADTLRKAGYRPGTPKAIRVLTESATGYTTADRGDPEWYYSACVELLAHAGADEAEARATAAAAGPNPTQIPVPLTAGDPPVRPARGGRPTGPHRLTPDLSVSSSSVVVSVVASFATGRACPSTPAGTPGPRSLLMATTPGELVSDLESV
jgi:hypothetical protein